MSDCLHPKSGGEASGVVLGFYEAAQTVHKSFKKGTKDLGGCLE